MASHLNLNPFYVKRYLEKKKNDVLGKDPKDPRVKNRRTVHFIASANSQVGDISSKRKLNTWKHKEKWFGISTCSEGEITYLEVSDGRHTGISGISAKRCGFEMILAYLCFRNIEHQNDNTHRYTTFGYDILKDLHWKQGNMPELRQSLVFQHCRSIIHVNYRKMRDFPQQVSLYGDSILSGALAAGYRHLITYNPSPCGYECCPYEGPRAPEFLRVGWFKGKIFWLHGLLNDFNEGNVRYLESNTGSIKERDFQSNIDSPESFAKHHGNYWYFCSNKVPNS